MTLPSKSKAEIAYKNTCKSREYIFNEELETIYRLIERAADDGAMFIRHSVKLEDTARRLLDKLSSEGFTVDIEHGSADNSYTLDISWLQ